MAGLLALLEFYHYTTVVTRAPVGGIVEGAHREPPGIGRTRAEAVRVADMVLMPSKPSLLDVWACADIVEAVKARQRTTGGLPKVAFVITMARPRTLLVEQVETALAEYGIPALSARTTERVAYPTTAIEGKSVLDGRDRTAQQEILVMRDEIEMLCRCRCDPGPVEEGKQEGCPERLSSSRRRRKRRSSCTA